VPRARKDTRLQKGEKSRPVGKIFSHESHGKDQTEKERRRAQRKELTSTKGIGRDKSNREAGELKKDPPLQESL